jgi:lipoprotein-anchoring transpeptidase ErfK/SrfK
MHCLAKTAFAAAALAATALPASAAQQDVPFFLAPLFAALQQGPAPAAAPAMQDARYAAQPRYQTAAYDPAGTPAYPYQDYQPQAQRPLQNTRDVIGYQGPHQPGTIVINTSERKLYLVMDGGRALRYAVGVGREGFQWAGSQKITNKQEWPDWRPPADMLRRRPDLPRYMAGGLSNPLGARALYLGASIYRIHGSNEPETIGQAVSSGCIRMLNEDVVDLYNRVKVGTQVVVQR